MAKMDLSAPIWLSLCGMAMCGTLYHRRHARQWRPVEQALPGTATKSNDGVGTADCNSRRAVGPTKTIRGVYMTQLNRLERLAALSAIREWSFYV